VQLSFSYFNHTFTLQETLWLTEVSPKPMKISFLSVLSSLPSTSD
jgi:hypothetical protein